MKNFPKSKVKKQGVATTPAQIIDLWELLEHRPWKGQRTKKEITQQIQQERKNWDKITKL